MLRHRSVILRAVISHNPTDATAGKQAKAQDGAPEHPTPEEQSVNESQARKGGDAEKITVDNPGVACGHNEESTAKGNRDGLERDMKGAATDEKNSDAASMLRARLGL